MSAASLYRLTAFSDTAKGGNPAGVWVGEHLPAPAAMQTIAAEVGFSETAFLAPGHVGEWQIRYFSPQAEVSFCGHATIAAAALLGQLSGAGNYRLSSAVGEVEVRASLDQDRWRASFRTVTPRQRPLPDSLLVAALTCLRWRSEELDPGIPQRHRANPECDLRGVGAAVEHALGGEERPALDAVEAPRQLPFHPDLDGEGLSGFV